MFGGAIAGSTAEYRDYILPGIVVLSVLFNTVYSGGGRFTGTDETTMWKWLRENDMPFDTRPTREIHAGARTLRDWLLHRREQGHSKRPQEATTVSTVERMAGRVAAVALVASLLTGCSGAAVDQALVTQSTMSSTSSSTSTSTTTTSRTTTTTTVRPRPVTQQPYTPFAAAGGVVLRHPAARVERIGFHESNLDGAQQLETLPTSAPTLVLEGRARDTTARGAADVMVDPDAEIRAPVTGTVRAAGTYVLYCQYSDDFLIIEPDDRPGWEVKMLHIDGVRVRPGARVQAGVTVVAPRATRLPFESQVEEGSYRPAWPHVHIEIDDPNVPDRPTGPGC